MTKTLLTTSLIVLFFGCNESKKDTSKSDFDIKWDKQKKLDTVNLNQAIKFSHTYNAAIGWDTTESFTYSLQELLQGSNKPISLIGEIKDVIKNDTVYILKVVGTNSLSFKSFIAEISVSEVMFQELKTHLKPNESNEACFIFNVSKISSHQPILKSEVESNGQNVDDATSYLTLDFNENLIKFQGKLTAYYFYERLKEEDE